MLRENISEHNQYNISVFFPTEEASVIYIRFRDDISFGKAKSEIERVCRNYVPESLPLDITTTGYKKKIQHKVSET